MQAHTPTHNDTVFYVCVILPVPSLFFSFFYPIQSKINISSFVPDQIENREFCDWEAFKGFEGTEINTLPPTVGLCVIIKD